MDALSLLTADHNRVRGLFARFEAAHEGGDTAAAADLAANILIELDVHTQIEEEIFYPAVRTDQELNDLVAEGMEEHHVVKELGAEIRSLSPDDEAWAAKCKVVIENVEHHLEEEEEEMFPMVRKAFTAESLEGIGQSLEARKAQLGAPTAADKEHLTVEQLHELATAQQIPGRSEMKREELVATVSPT